MRNLQNSFFVFIILSIFSLTVFSAPNFGPVVMGNFYSTLPDPDPNAKLGTLVKAEKINTSVAGANAWRIAYISSDIKENKTLVTGILVAPTGPAPRAGRPIMAWAHGTTGTAQTCGPSQVIAPAEPLNQYFMLNGNSWTDYGLPAMVPFIKAGYVIVATDYQGLGGGGKHQYTVAVTQAHDVIDSIRAARLLKEAGAGPKAIIYGWSQGGGAALAAASLADYINQTGTASDGIQLLGFVALAPFDIAATIPANITTTEEANKFVQNLANSFSANVFDFTHYAQNIWGMVAAFPELRLDDIFTPKGVAVVDESMQRKCMQVLADTLNYIYANNYKSLLRPDIKNSLAWLNAYKAASVPAIKPIAPVIIYWGNKDVTVPPIMGKLYTMQMCKLGGNITRVELPGDQTHFTTPASAEPLYVEWVKDRFEGIPAPNGCNKN